MFKRKMDSNFFGTTCRYRIEEDLKSWEGEYNRKVKTKEDLLDFLCGNYDSRPETTLNLYLYTPVRTEWYHRLNMFWAYPLTLCLYPFRYVLYGDGGWTNKTRMGKFLLKCVAQDS